MAAMLWTYAGFSALALAMPKHWRSIGSANPEPPALALRGAAIVALIAALFVCVDAYGAAVGATVWVGVLSAGVGAFVALVSLWPRIAAGAGVAALLAALAISVARLSTVVV